MSRPLSAAAMASIVAMTLLALWAGNMQLEAAAGGCGSPSCGAQISLRQLGRAAWGLLDLR
jgi:hypothetical protein